MPTLEPPFRPARPEDAPALAELINMAGEGLPHHLWGRMAGPGESAWEVGRRRVLRDEGGSSWRNGTVIEEDGAVVACLFGYALPDVPEPIDPAMPAMFVPLQELENLAPGTWYVNILAVAPARRGLGTALLRLADRLGLEHGTSVIVADANRGARRLYERCGYARRATRPMVKEAWENPSTAWVLLVKDPDGTAG
jgi:ribosomal protein S18 acetylase RimI-like enzyme